MCERLPRHWGFQRGVPPFQELYAAEAGELKSKWTFATAWEDGVAARFKTWQLEGTKLQVRYMEASTEPYTEADVLHVLADSEDDDEDD